MRRNTFRKVARYVSLPISAWPNTELIAEYCDVTVEAVISIYSQTIQHQITCNISRFRSQLPATLRRYQQGCCAVELAFALNFPPCLLIRHLLQNILRLGRQSIAQVLRDPTTLLTWSNPNTTQRAETDAVTQPTSGSGDVAANAGSVSGDVGNAPTDVNLTSTGDVESSLKDEGIVELPLTDDVAAEPTAATGAQRPRPAAWEDAALVARLAADVEACVENDWMSSPHADAVRHVSGLEAEAALCATLTADGVAYWSEENLRESGYIKTPDVRLQVPIQSRGTTIFWIDSKATFGDDQQHKAQLAAQYRKYVNRYGCGAVIYWEGFVAELASPAHEEGLLLLDSCPTGGLRLDRVDM